MYNAPTIDCKKGKEERIRWLLTYGRYQNSGKSYKENRLNYSNIYSGFIHFGILIVETVDLWQYDFPSIVECEKSTASQNF